MTFDKYVRQDLKAILTFSCHPRLEGVLKNPGYVVLGLGHAKGVCVTQHLTPCWIMVASHIRLGGQDLPQHANICVLELCRDNPLWCYDLRTDTGACLYRIINTK